MMMKRKIVVLDATVLITLAQMRQFHVLGHSTSLEFVAPDQVIAEVKYKEEIEALDEALRLGYLRKESATDNAEKALYGELKTRMDDGEAACLAMAYARGWMLVSDDRGRAFRRMATDRIGKKRLLDTPELLRLLGVDEAGKDQSQEAKD